MKSRIQCSSIQCDTWRDRGVILWVIVLEEFLEEQGENAIHYTQYPNEERLALYFPSWLAWLVVKCDSNDRTKISNN